MSLLPFQVCSPFEESLWSQTQPNRFLNLANDLEGITSALHVTSAKILLNLDEFFDWPIFSMNFSNSLKHVVHYRRHAKSVGTIDSSQVSHHNIANFFGLVISICPSWHFSPRLNGLSGEPVELFRNKSARGGSELPANVSPEAIIMNAWRS